MKTKIVALMILASALGACQTNKVLQATGGSRSDGTVELAYEYGALEQPVIDWVQADATALARCKAWGYPTAERFGGQKTQCNSPGPYGCNAWLATVTYQCTGNIAPPAK